VKRAMMRVSEMGQRDVNAVVGVLGVTLLGILSLWFPTAVLNLSIPKGVFSSMGVNFVWYGVALGFFPYLWAMRRLGMSLGDLGLSRDNLGISVLLGCSLYTLALVTFLHCSGGEMMRTHAVRTATAPVAVVMGAYMSVLVAGTDLFTRGFILLSLARHTHVLFAIVMQNAIWYLGHRPEIHQLADCLGVGGATAVTLTLGIGGDMVVLRTRNVIGLCVAHALLNIVLVVYLRQM